MIPVSLNLKNFMSYKSLDLDFSEIHVACLSGENGAGKSTILDAITWSVWNESRAAHSDDLIKLGESEMSAELIFDIDIQRYKIIRNAKKIGKKKVSMQAGVELQILAEKGYKSITGKSTTETNKRILDIVKMNYDTFINSAFILQGKADAFTTKKPTDRKKLLAEILNLEQYKSLEEKTKKKLKLFQDEKKLIERENEHNRTRIQDEEVIKAELDNAQYQSEKTNEKLVDSEQKIKIKTEEKQEINIKLSSLNQLKKLLADSNINLQQNQEKVIESERRLGVYEGYILRKEDIESNFNLLSSFKIQDQDLSEKLIKSTDTEKRINNIKKDIASEKHKLELQLTEINGKLSRLEDDKKEALKTLKDEEKILKIYNDLKQLKEEQKEYQERGVRFTRLSDKKTYLEKKLNDELNKLKIEESNFKLKIKEREDKIKQKRIIEEKKSEIENQLQEIDKSTVYLEAIKTKGIELKSIIRRNEETINTKKTQELPAYQEKIEKWKQVHDANCPMCNTHLNEIEKQAIIDKYKNEIEIIELDIAKLSAENIKIDKQCDEYREKYSKLAKQVNQRNDLGKNLGEFEKTLNDIAQFEKDLISLKKDLNQINEKINNRNFSPEIQKELADIINEIKNLEYNPETLSVMQAKINSLGYAEIKHSQLESDKKKLNHIEKELPDLTESKEKIEKVISDNSFAVEKMSELESLQKDLISIGYDESEHSTVKSKINELKIFEDENQKLQKSMAMIDSMKELITNLKQEEFKIKVNIEQYTNDTKAIPELEEKLKLISQSLDSENLIKENLVKENEVLRDNISKNTEKLNQINTLKKEIGESEEKFKFLDNEIELHKELVNAFSKDGIQAIIIENSIPEIENYANNLLTQMTEGRMNIKFSTIKANRSNDNISETLDIYISDELGTRNYEMYSGGEAFRVNFAIRLALSKMLAKRAGTKLKTLVIDEGFGTQDSKGIAKLIEAINIVKKDFEKILIITHINDLKEAFPDRIEVYKTIHGSEIRLVS